MWQSIRNLLFGTPGSTMPIGCLTIPGLMVYGLYRWVKSWFTGKE